MRGIRGTCKMIPWRCRCCALHRPEGDPCAKGWWGRQAQPAPPRLPSEGECVQDQGARKQRTQNQAKELCNTTLTHLSLPFQALVARTIFSVQKSFRRTGKRRSQSVQGRCPVKTLAITLAAGAALWAGSERDRE